MNYQTQQIIQAMTTLMTLGMFVRLPVVMLQVATTDYEKERELVDKYGLWEVKRAEAVCPKGDWLCIESESARLAALLRARYR